MSRMRHLPFPAARRGPSVSRRASPASDRRLPPRPSSRSIRTSGSPSGELAVENVQRTFSTGCYVFPRHKAANWVGPGRGRKSTRPGASGVVELSPFDFLDRLADPVPPPRKHRHRYHGVFAPNHKLRSTVTALAIGNVGKRCDAATDGHAVGGHAARGDATADCCDVCDKPPSHDTSRIAWAKLMARVGEEFPVACPGRGGDIRLIAFITDPRPIRKILTPVLLQTEWRTARATARLSRPWSADRLGRVRAGPLSTGQSFRRRPTSCPTSTSTASDGIPCTVRTAREKSGFKAGSSQRETFDLERG